MIQFDVYENRGNLKKYVPYVLDVQSNLISQGISTRVVVPLYHASLIKKAALKIHVPVTVENKKLLALFDELASVESIKLGAKIVSLSTKHFQQFKEALDVLFFNLP